MSSRQVGSNTEYLVCASLIKMGHKPMPGYTNKRMQQISTSLSTSNNKKLEADLITALKRIIGPSKKLDFSLMPDTHGSSTSVSRSTSDIVIHSQPEINISIKHNNFSLKHQKAGNLWSQMRMCESRKRRFLEAYNKIGSTWLSRWSGYSAFADMPAEAKKELYDKVNGLTLKNLVSAPHKDVCGYIDFVLDLQTHNKFILRIDSGSGSVRIMQMNIASGARINKIKRTGNFIEIGLPNDVTVRMRLHTCKTRVTKTLALKYDTQIRGGLVEL